MRSEREQPGQAGLTRRSLLTAAAAVGAGMLGGGCENQDSLAATKASGLSSGPRPGDGPEVRDLRFGIIALTDCSPIVIAHEKGLFKKFGIRSTVVKGASWAAIRDSLSNGDLHGTHMLLGMPIASTMGLLGSPKRPMVIPWLLNRNGQGITVRASLKGSVQADAKALKPLVDAARARGAPMTFAMTFPPGTHAMWMRYWLGSGGINPDTDAALITIPPPQMVANMRVGKMDAFCVGEPWNARAISDGIGYTAITSQELWKDHPEKAFAFAEPFAQKNPKTVKACLKALHEASVWLDRLENRREQARIVSQPTYINCAPELILGRLLGRYEYGDGRKKQDEHCMIFHQRNCNFPQPKYAKWWLSQFRRWGMVQEPPDYDRLSARVMRTDLYEEAMKELGYAHGGRNDDPETLFDGVTFDPGKPEQYALSFAVHSRKG